AGLDVADLLRRNQEVQLIAEVAEALTRQFEKTKLQLFEYPVDSWFRIRSKPHKDPLSSEALLESGLDLERIPAPDAAVHRQHHGKADWEREHCDVDSGIQ